jgi:hypothetical protein
VDFIRFWLENILSGLDVADSTFAKITDVFLFIGLALLVCKKSVWKDKWKLWEERIMKGAFYMSLTFFTLIAFVIEPYTKDKTEYNGRIQDDKENVTLRNDLKAAQDRNATLSDALMTGKYGLLANEPIASVSATVDLRIPSNEVLNIWDASALANILFTQKGGIVVAWSTKFSAQSVEAGVADVSFKADVKSSDACIGKPISFLATTSAISIAVPELVPFNSKVLEGGVVCVINDHILLKFKIGPQDMKGDSVTISDLEEGLKPIREPKPPTTQSAE